MDSRKKYGWVTSLRAFAALAIVLLHVIGGWSAENAWGGLTGIRWFLDGIVIQVLVRWSVPVFVMISGFLLLNPDKEMQLSKIRKYTLRMAAVLLTFGYAYCLMETIATNGLTNIPMSLLLSARNLVEGKSWAHMWYVYMLIGLYLLTPMLRTFVSHADERTMQWTLTLLLVLTIICPTINALTGMELSALIPVSAPYLFYYLLGYELLCHPIRRRTALALLITGAAGTALMLLIGRDTPEVVAQPDNIFVAIYAVGIFSLAMNSNCLERLSCNQLIGSLAKYSFGIYLLHPLFLNLLNKGLHLFPDVLPTEIGEICFFLYALMGAFFSAWLLCRIRGFRKMLIG